MNTTKKSWLAHVFQLLCPHPHLIQPLRLYQVHPGVRSGGRKHSPSARKSF